MRRGNGKDRGRMEGGKDNGKGENRKGENGKGENGKGNIGNGRVGGWKRNENCCPHTLTKLIDLNIATQLLHLLKSGLMSN